MSYVDICRKDQIELGLVINVPIENGMFCAYDTENKIIYVNLDDAAYQGEEFYSFVEELFADARQFSLGFLSLLHEFGHHYDIMDYDAAEDTILRMVADSVGYYRIPSEYAATEWAVNFIIQNRAKCEVINELFIKEEKVYFKNM